MTRQEELLELYATELRDKCGIEPDATLLRRVALGCGPAIYDPEAAVVAPDDHSELARIRRNFLVGKLGLPDTHDLTDAIETMMDLYEATPGQHYRAVIYYMLVQHFGKAHLYR